MRASFFYLLRHSDAEFRWRSRIRRVRSASVVSRLDPEDRHFSAVNVKRYLCELRIQFNVRRARTMAHERKNERNGEKRGGKVEDIEKNSASACLVGGRERQNLMQRANK